MHGSMNVKFSSSVSWHLLLCLTQGLVILKIPAYNLASVWTVTFEQSIKT